MTGIFGERKLGDKKLPPFHTRILASQTGAEDFVMPEPVIVGKPKEEQPVITGEILEQQYENIVNGSFSATNDINAEKIVAGDANITKRIFLAVETNKGVLVYLYPKDQMVEINKQLQMTGVKMVPKFDVLGNCDVIPTFMGEGAVVIFTCEAVALNSDQTIQFKTDQSSYEKYLRTYQQLGISQG